jgi:NitT/TauT family transport system substrate-binding protein
VSPIDPRHRTRVRILVALALFLLGAAGLSSCSDDGGEAGADGGSDDSQSGDTNDGDGEQTTLKLGYFPNVTHSPALVGLHQGLYDEALGDGVSLETFDFSQGSEASEALLSGAIDATFIGPNPAINAFAQTNGEKVRIVSGSTSGGASLVVTADITEPSQLEGTTLATPSLGNTQDVALRAWLGEQGFEVDESGGGDVTILNQDNADTLASFVDGTITGAWVPEPWATRLVEEGDGHVLVDEADLWPEGQFVTTHLIVATEYLEEHPDVIKSLLEGHHEAVDFANESPEEAQAAVVARISEVTGQDVSPELIANSWDRLTFTLDPIAGSLFESAAHAEEVGLLDPVDLDGIYDLTLLNEVLAEAGEEEVAV